MNSTGGGAWRRSFPALRPDRTQFDELPPSDADSPPANQRSAIPPRSPSRDAPPPALPGDVHRGEPSLPTGVPPLESPCFGDAQPVAEFPTGDAVAPAPPTLPIPPSPPPGRCEGEAGSAVGGSPCDDGDCDSSAKEPVQVTGAPASQGACAPPASEAISAPLTPPGTAPEREAREGSACPKATFGKLGAGADAKAKDGSADNADAVLGDEKSHSDHKSIEGLQGKVRATAKNAMLGAETVGLPPEDDHPPPQTFTSCVPGMSGRRPGGVTTKTRDMGEEPLLQTSNPLPSTDSDLTLASTARSPNGCLREAASVASPSQSSDGQSRHESSTLGTAGLAEGPSVCQPAGRGFRTGNSGHGDEPTAPCDTADAEGVASSPLSQRGIPAPHPSPAMEQAVATDAADDADLTAAIDLSDVTHQGDDAEQCSPGAVTGSAVATGKDDHPHSTPFPSSPSPPCGAATATAATAAAANAGIASAAGTPWCASMSSPCPSSSGKAALGSGSMVCRDVPSPRSPCPAALAAPAASSRTVAEPSSPRTLRQNASDDTDHDPTSSILPSRSPIKSQSTGHLNHRTLKEQQELRRCEAYATEIMSMLEQERRRHSEECRDRERRMEAHIAKQREQWRDEVASLQDELRQLRAESAAARAGGSAEPPPPSVAAASLPTSAAAVEKPAAALALPAAAVGRPAPVPAAAAAPIVAEVTPALPVAASLRGALAGVSLEVPAAHGCISPEHSDDSAGELPMQQPPTFSSSPFPNSDTVAGVALWDACGAGKQPEPRQGVSPVQQQDRGGVVVGAACSAGRITAAPSETAVVASACGSVTAIRSTSAVREIARSGVQGDAGRDSQAITAAASVEAPDVAAASSSKSAQWLFPAPRASPRGEAAVAMPSARAVPPPAVRPLGSSSGVPTAYSHAAASFAVRSRSPSPEHGRPAASAGIPGPRPRSIQRIEERSPEPRVNHCTAVPPRVPSEPVEGPVVCRCDAVTLEKPQRSLSPRHHRITLLDTPRRCPADAVEVFRPPQSLGSVAAPPKSLALTPPVPAQMPGSQGIICHAPAAPPVLQHHVAPHHASVATVLSGGSGHDVQLHLPRSPPRSQTPLRRHERANVAAYHQLAGQNAGTELQLQRPRSPFRSQTPRQRPDKIAPWQPIALHGNLQYVQLVSPGTAGTNASLHPHSSCQ